MMSRSRSCKETCSAPETVNAAPAFESEEELLRNFEIEFLTRDEAEAEAEIPCGVGHPVEHIVQHVHRERLGEGRTCENQTINCRGAPAMGPEDCGPLSPMLRTFARAVFE
jgi:hypothetical protein